MIDGERNLVFGIVEKEKQIEREREKAIRNLWKRGHTPLPWSSSSSFHHSGFYPNAEVIPNTFYVFVRLLLCLVNASSVFVLATGLMPALRTPLKSPLAVLRNAWRIVSMVSSP